MPLAWDGDPETAWTTLWYNEADIGNKSGLGIIFDLGCVRQVSRVELNLVGNGTSSEVRVPQAESTDAAPTNSIDQWRTVGGADGAAEATTVTLDQPVSTRFVLVYLTALPPDGGRFSGGIAEARFWG